MRGIHTSRTRRTNRRKNPQPGPITTHNPLRQTVAHVLLATLFFSVLVCGAFARSVGDLGAALSAPTERACNRETCCNDPITCRFGDAFRAPGLNLSPVDATSHSDASQAVFGAPPLPQVLQPPNDTDVLRVLSWNVWGLKYISQDREIRMEAIAHALSQSDYDIIALQELWVYEDYATIRAALSTTLPHTKYFYSGALGAGLAFFSRWPIIGTTLHPYSLNGSPIDVAGGDWFVGKSAAGILLSHPQLGPIQIFNTHMFSRASPRTSEYLRTHHLVNAYELGKLAVHAAELGRHVLAMGDLNAVPDQLPIELIQAQTGMQDTWATVHPPPPAGEDGDELPESAKDAVLEHGITAASPLNTYSDAHPGGYVKKHKGKRLDYVFFRAPMRAQGRVLEAQEAKVVFTEHVPGRTHSFSDHFGLAATFRIVPAAALAEDGGDTQDTKPAPARQDPPRVPPEMVDVMVGMLTRAYYHSVDTHQTYLFVSIVCLVLLFVIIIGSTCLPHVHFSTALVMLTVCLSWLGTTMLYIGFVYGRWVGNALINVVEELQILKAGLEPIA